MEIINSILQIGRHFFVSLAFTTHVATKGPETNILLIEANIIVLFPKTSGCASMRYVLDNYLGLDSKQIKEEEKKS